MSDLPLAAPRRFTSPIYGESGYERRRNDAYYTEPWVTEALLSAVVLRDVVWECAAGRGDMVKVLMRHCHRLYASDIAPPHDAINGIEARDFLAQRKVSGIGSIVTNPPYGRIGAEFARHALKLMEPVSGMVALLARQEWDSAKERRDIFADHSAFALKITLTRRPLWDWWEPTLRKRAAPRHNFAWYVWDWRTVGHPPIIRYAP